MNLGFKLFNFRFRLKRYGCNSLMGCFIIQDSYPRFMVTTILRFSAPALKVVRLLHEIKPTKKNLVLWYTNCLEVQTRNFPKKSNWVSNSYSFPFKVCKFSKTRGCSKHFIYPPNLKISPGAW